MPAVLLCQDLHRGIGVLLAKPSKDGPPDMIVMGSEDTLRTPCMPVEGRPTQKQGIQQAQTIREAFVLRRYVEERSDLSAQALRAVLRDDQPR